MAAATLVLGMLERNRIDACSGPRGSIEPHRTANPCQTANIARRFTARRTPRALVIVHNGCSTFGMLIAIWPLVILIAGLLIYVLASNAKVVEIGRLTFFVGIFWLTYALVSKTIHIG